MLLKGNLTRVVIRNDARDDLYLKCESRLSLINVFFFRNKLRTFTQIPHSSNDRMIKKQTALDRGTIIRNPRRL